MNEVLLHLSIFGVHYLSLSFVTSPYSAFFFVTRQFHSYILEEVVPYVVRLLWCFNLIQVFTSYYLWLFFFIIKMTNDLCTFLWIVSSHTHTENPISRVSAKYIVNSNATIWCTDERHDRLPDRQTDQDEFKIQLKCLLF